VQVFFGNPKNSKCKKADVLYILGDIFCNKWTIANGGVSTYEGWKPEAQTRFEELRAMNKEARDKETTEAIEEAILGLLREKKGRTATSIHEERAQKRRRVRASLMDEEEDDEENVEDLCD
jgi:hypothetical protein